MKFNKNTILSLSFIIFFAFVSTLISQLDFFLNMGFSSLIIAIFLGIVFTNILNIKLPKSFDKGISFCTKSLLRIAIVFYGFRLTFHDVLDVGFVGFFSSIVIVITTFTLGYFIGIKILKLDKEIVILTSAGSAICGAAAVLASEGVLKNKAYKSAIAVSTVVLFGTIAMFIYPYFYTFLSYEENFMALYIGATLHEVAHVVGASNTVGGETVPIIAVVVKMLRVMLLAPFLIILSFYLSKTINIQEKRKITIPWFAIFFIFVAIFNSFDLINTNIVNTINEVDTFLLCMAMFALGVKTDLKTFKEVGIRPVLLALILFLWLIFGGYFIVDFALSV